MPNLLITGPGTSSKCYKLQEDVVTIGRLPENSIQIQNESVSSYHAKLILRNGAYLLKDLGSTNRSWVEGVPVSESEIKRSCAIRFGSVECKLVFDEKPIATNQKPAEPTQPAQKPEPASTAGEIGSHEKDILSLTRQRDALLQTNNTLSAKLAELQRSHDANKAADSTKMAARTPQAGAAATGQDNDLVAVRRQRDALQQVTDQLAPKLAEAEKKLKFVAAEREATLRANEELVSRLAEARREFEALTATRETYHNQHQELLDSINEQREKINLLKDERDAAIQASDELQQDMEEMEKKLKTLIKERDHLAAELDDLNANSDAVEDSDAEEEEEEEEDFVEEAVHKKRPSAKKGHKQPELPRSQPARSAPARQPVEARRAEVPLQPERKAVIQPIQSVARPERIFKPVEFVPVSSEEMLRERCGEISELMRKLQTELNYFVRHQKDLHLLKEICGQMEALRQATALAPLRPAYDLVSSLDDWLFDLSCQSQLIDSSALRTCTQAVELLDSIFGSDRCMRLKHLWPPRALAVDDDPDVLDAVTGSMSHVKLSTSTAHDARQGLQKLYEEKFDLIILDVGLPGVNGLDLCSEIGSMPNHAATPILFLTGATNPETRAQTAIQGGKDFIAKPFRISELALRALTWALGSQIKAV